LRSEHGTGYQEHVAQKTKHDWTREASIVLHLHDEGAALLGRELDLELDQVDIVGLHTRGGGEDRKDGESSNAHNIYKLKAKIE